MIFGGFIWGSPRAGRGEGMVPPDYVKIFVSQICTDVKKTRLRTKSQIGQNPELEKIQNGKTPECTKSRIEQNPKWTKSRIGQNPELDKIQNGQNPELDKIQNGKTPE